MYLSEQLAKGQENQAAVTSIWIICYRSIQKYKTLTTKENMDFDKQRFTFSALSTRTARQ